MAKEQIDIFSKTNTYIIFSITLLAVMGVASVAPAFPSIIKYFDISKSQIGLLITVFTVPGIVLTPITGILADRFGRKRILIPSLLLFALAGTACVFAESFSTLLILRFFQGLGATSLGSINITLIGDLYSGKQRAKLMGVNASVLSVGTASYPMIGGFLASISWHWVFILPSLGALVALMVFFKLRNPEPETHQDIATYFSNVWKNINQQSVWAMFFISIILFVVLYGSMLTFMPILLSETYAKDTRAIGLTLSVMSISTAIVSSQLAKIHRIISQKQSLIFGGFAYFIAMLIITASNSYLVIILAMIVYGFGHGILIPSLQNILVGFAPLAERAAFMSINSMVLRIGQSIGPLLIGAFLVFGDLKFTFIAGAFFSLLIPIIAQFGVKKLK